MPRVKRTVRNSVSDRPSPWRLMLRRQRRFVRPAMWVIGGSAALLFGIAVVRSMNPGAAANESLRGLRERIGSVTAASGLRVRNVVIEGRANTPEPLLRAAIGVSPGDPILGFSVEQARSRIETLSWVEHATVERLLPDTVVVHLQERAPFAIWQNHGGFQLVDRAGQVVNQDISQFRKLPRIVGEGAPAAAAPLLDALTDRPALADKVLAAVRVGQRRWNLRMKNGTDVMLPEGHETTAMDRLMALEQDHSLLERPLAAIDMRLPDRLVLQPREDAAANPLPPGTKGNVVPAVAKKPT
jgi:cell division protein FtsQ